jgi:hypothetical protein
MSGNSLLLHVFMESKYCLPLSPSIYFGTAHPRPVRPQLLTATTSLLSHRSRYMGGGGEMEPEAADFTLNFASCANRNEVMQQHGVPLPSAQNFRYL